MVGGVIGRWREDNKKREETQVDYEDRPGRCASRRPGQRDRRRIDYEHEDENEDEEEERRVV